ncbi:hypothetical protein, partial [Bacillus sp. GZT]|uniref:hypothetical protein n=1 Tax=Bacillus sp. GZT TaxID=936600 RepID=UPI00079FF65C
MTDKQKSFKGTGYGVDLLDELDRNTKFARNKSIKHFLKYFLAIIFIECILAYLLELKFGYIWGAVVVISALFIYFFDTRKYYEELESLLNIVSHIRDLKDSPNARGEIKVFINNYNINIERAKLLLDLLKSFSPIPIIVFLSGLLLNTDLKNFTFLFDDLSSISYYKTAYLIAIMVLFIVYMAKIFKTWDRYKFLQFRMLQYQNAYDELEEKAKVKKEEKEEKEKKEKKEKNEEKEEKEEK